MGFFMSILICRIELKISTRSPESARIKTLWIRINPIFLTEGTSEEDEDPNEN